MYKIITKQVLATDIKRLDIKAEAIAAHAQAGQFVIVIPEQDQEWIPLTIIECNLMQGSISLIFQEMEAATKKLGAMPISDSIYAILGPFGRPASVRKYGAVICAATGVGTAQILPICRALKKAGNKVIGVIGAKTKKKLMLEAQMRLACHFVYLTTEDGSYQRRGTVTQTVKELLDRESISLVYTIGSVDMMQEITLLAGAKSISTLIQSNPYIFCGSGLCASCRVRVGKKIVLACAEGPEFDGQQVDFEDLRMRLEVVKKISQDGQGDQREEETNKQGFLSKLLGKS